LIQYHPLVSVVIAVHNCENHIACAISSALRQTYLTIELIVVDDGSSDQTYLNAVACIEGVRNATIVSQENRGVSAARNAGVRCASPDAKYLFFLDADDFLEQNAIETMVAYMEEHPAAGLLTCGFDAMNEETGERTPGHRTRMRKARFWPLDMKQEEQETPFEVFFCATGQGPFALYRRSVFEQTRGWSEEFWGHNDTDMFIQMALESKIHHLPARLYIKRNTKNSLLTRLGRDELYTKLRRKWDEYECGDARKMKLLEDARKYYRTTHKPWRDLKIAMLALINFLRNPSSSRWKWFYCLFTSGVQGLVKGGAEPAIVKICLDNCQDGTRGQRELTSSDDE
jgi:glycosyltransferase involved in cell wall biosynthesis